MSSGRVTSGCKQGLTGKAKTCLQRFEQSKALTGMTTSKSLLATIVVTARCIETS